MKRGAGALIASLAVWVGGAASAQTYQCTVPATLVLPRTEPDGAVRRADVAGYTLALSWSPEFCRTRAGQKRHAQQCSGNSGQFGLVVHGLWPQGARGASPQWCPARPATAVEARSNACISPSGDLLARQWAKHGSCMARRPATYFKVTRILYAGLRLPDLDFLSRQRGLTAGFLRTRFAEANPGWSPGAIGIHANARGWLEEVRLCYDRRFLPASCDRGRYGLADAAPLKIWRGL